MVEGYFVLIIVRFRLNCLIIVCVVGFKFFISKLIIKLILIKLIFIVILDLNVFFVFVLNNRFKIKMVIGKIIVGFRFNIVCIFDRSLFIFIFYFFFVIF